MNFTISKQAFGNALAIVGHAVSSSSPQPYLRGIYIEASGNELVLTGSNADISIQKKVIADDENKLNIVEEGSILMEASYLNEIVKKLDADIISVEIIDGSLTRFAGSEAVFKINGMNTNDYPKIDFSKPMSSISMPASLLLEIIDQTTFAASTKETKPVLTGVNFHLADNVLKCTATDSYRLAKKTLDFKSDADFNITIPSKSLQEVVRSLSEDIDKVQLYIDSKKAQFVFGKTIFQTRLLDGTFPSVEKIIPTSSVASMVVDAHELASVIDRTNFIRNDKVHLVKLECSPEIVRIKTNSTEIGSSDEVLTDCMYKGDNLTLTCNGSYILDAIRALSGSKVDLEFSGDMRPIRILNPKDDSIVIVVVPVRSYD